MVMGMMGTIWWNGCESHHFVKNFCCHTSTPYVRQIQCAMQSWAIWRKPLPNGCPVMPVCHHHICSSPFCTPNVCKQLATIPCQIDMWACCSDGQRRR
jgi:hypothetical protein